MLRTLGQLAARELGLARSEPAAVLAPRLPSRYEQADAAAAAGRSHEEASHDAAVDHFHANAAAIPTPDRVADATRIENVSPMADVTKRAGNEAGARAPRESHDKPDRRESAAGPIEAVHPARSDTPFRSVAIRPPPPGPLPPAPNDGIRRLPVAAVGEAVAPRRARKHEDIETQRPAVRAHAESRTPPREASALRPLAPAPLPPRAAASAAAAARVYVTIGRLEIRATTEAAPAVAPAPRAAATPSLASYLRRRSDGRRS